MSNTNFFSGTLEVANISNPDEMLKHYQDWLDNPFTKVFHQALDERITHNVNAMVSVDDMSEMYRIQGAAREDKAIINLPDLIAAEIRDLSETRAQEAEEAAGGEE